MSRKRPRRQSPITGFLEVASHAILHCRGVYEGKFFKRKRKFNTSTWACENDDLIEYLANAAATAERYATNGELVSFVLVIKDRESQAALERYDFSFVDGAGTGDAAVTEETLTDAIHRIGRLHDELPRLPSSRLCFRVYYSIADSAACDAQDEECPAPDEVGIPSPTKLGRDEGMVVMPVANADFAKARVVLSVHHHEGKARGTER